MYNFTIIYPPHLASTFPIHLNSWTPEPILETPLYSSNSNKNFCPIYKLTKPHEIFGCNNLFPKDLRLREDYSKYPELLQFENVIIFSLFLLSNFTYSFNFS